MPRLMLSELPYLPFRAVTRLMQAAAMVRHRRLATLHPGAQILADGWIQNPEGSRNRVEIGAKTIIRGHLFVFPHGGRIKIGEWSIIGQQSQVWSSASIIIGNWVEIGDQVHILDTDGHSLNPALRREQFRAIATTGHPTDASDIRCDPIVIEDDAWIGAGAFVLKGVTIGAAAVVAAGAVVTKSVAPYTIVAGNPARVVGTIDRCPKSEPVSP